MQTDHSLRVVPSVFTGLLEQGLLLDESAVGHNPSQRYPRHPGRLPWEFWISEKKIWCSSIEKRIAIKSWTVWKGRGSRVRHIHSDSIAKALGWCISHLLEFSRKCFFLYWNYAILKILLSTDFEKYYIIFFKYWVITQDRYDDMRGQANVRAGQPYYHKERDCFHSSSEYSWELLSPLWNFLSNSFTIIFYGCFI